MNDGIGAIIVGAVLTAVGIGSGNTTLAVPFTIGGIVAIVAGGWRLKG